MKCTLGCALIVLYNLPTLPYNLYHLYLRYCVVGIIYSQDDECHVNNVNPLKEYMVLIIIKVIDTRNNKIFNILSRFTAC